MMCPNPVLILKALGNTAVPSLATRQNQLKSLVTVYGPERAVHEGLISALYRWTEDSQSTVALATAIRDWTKEDAVMYVQNTL